MSMLQTIYKTIFGDPNEKQVQQIVPIVAQINSLESSVSILSDEELRAKTDSFKVRLAAGETLDTILPEAFAVVREASKRVLGMRHFDVQLMGGIVLHQGKIAEMKTGEGKTLASTLPAYLNALEGNGVYIVTVNDYLAKRDSESMGKIYSFLGLSVGLIQANLETETRVAAYACDITYGTNNEFGFDYLRDNLSWDLGQCCQLRRHFAIIDEVDSILIDEARTPLIISGAAQVSSERYLPISKIVKSLEKETHFTVEEKHKNIILTEAGIQEIESKLNLDTIYSLENMEIAHMAVQCLKAQYLYKRDVDYVVKEGEVLIVDEFTGRILEGRRYSDGLHQAIEAVENLSIREESQTLASVTYQNYFRMFPKLAGMTGTAATEADEFNSIYSLSVVQLPTNQPMIRADNADLVYKTKEEKFKAIIEEIVTVHTLGQPVLVGTISIESSEKLSKLLKAKGITHNVLNAKYHEREAEIIAKAGQKDAVTIATNMAGRGTDIVLGDGVTELGGLYVIGSERHESRRIDNQLRGRSGRQGDPGKSRFYVALDDDLMRMFGSDRIARVMDTLGVPGDTPIEHPLISRSIEKAQSKVEKYHFSIRKQILQYDDVMDKQRKTIYGIRHQILDAAKISQKIKEMISEYVQKRIAELYPTPNIPVDAEELEEFARELKVIFPINNLSEIVKNTDRAILAADLSEGFIKLYEARKAELPEGLFDAVICRRAILMTLDRRWMDHLHNMDILREGIGLRAYGQRDPLIEYKIEGFEMFQQLLLDVSEESLTMINKAELVIQEEDEEEGE